MARRAGSSKRPDGLAIRLAFSKTDQGAVGETVGVPYAGDPGICRESGHN
jgi:hypothetical protein